MQTNDFYYLGLIALFPLLGALVNGIAGAKLPRRLVDVIACGAILASFVTTLGAIAAMWSSRIVVGDQFEFPALTYTAYQWFYAGDLGIDLAFMLDPLTALLLLLVTGVGSLIHVYSIGYMEEDPSKWRYFSYLNLFCFAMLLLVLGKNLLVTFIGWEGVGVCSYLLIGFWYDDDAKAMAGQKAFVVNRVGDFAFLIGIFLLYSECGTLDYLELERWASSAALMPALIPIALIAGLMIFIGCTGKSAQIPLYVWLPDAMAGPTPVSALIHAATMVTSGIFLIGRLNWLFTLSPHLMALIAVVGALTAFFAATIAIVQTDIKKVLAYSTVSQLGYMFLAIGSGAFVAAALHVMTHAFFKALLFMGSGSVIHAMHHEQDIEKMGGLRRYMPWTAATFLIGCLAIAGFPLFSGFFSKDLILWSALSNGHVMAIDGFVLSTDTLRYLSDTTYPALVAGEGASIGVGFQLVSIVTFALGLITAAMTAFYMFRLYFLTFEGECRADEHTRAHLHESPPTMVIPLVALAVLSVIGGMTAWPHFVAHALHWEWMLFFEHWFHSVFAVSSDLRIFNKFGTHATGPEIGVTIAGTIAGLSGIALAYWIYIKNPHIARDARDRAARLRSVLWNKYYVDEVYDRLFVRGSIGSGIGLSFFDAHVLDQGAVDGVGHSAATVGRILRHMQSGNVQRYVGYVVLGVVLALFALLFPTFGF